MEGFIKLHRKMTEWEWYSDSNTKIVFLHILLLAKFKKSRYKGIDLLPGQAVISYRGLANELNLSVQNVRTAISNLKSTHELTLKVTHGKTVVTVEKWGVYQCYEGEANTESNTKPNTEVTHPKQKKERSKNNNIYIKPALGEFENVLLSEEELEKLKRRFPYDWQDKIERLSVYMQSKGKRYKSHYATILSWARKEEPKEEKRYDFKPSRS